jgi:peptide/nickel transport system substrate-binding protein
MNQYVSTRKIRYFDPIPRRQSIAVALSLVLATACICVAQPPPAPTKIPAALVNPARLENIASRNSRERPTSVAAAKTAAPTPTQAPKAKAAAKPGGMLRIGGERDVGDLDPHTSRIGWDINIMQNVYSGLVRAGTDILPQPDLATRWEFKTPKRLEFTLRQGVKFHNGREVIGEDVKFSLERILDPKVPAAYASTIATIDSIETPSKYLVVLNLKRPDAAIVANLSLPAMAIVAKEAVKPMPVGLKEEMMGSGPYMFKEHIKGQRLVLVKNPNYYEKGKPLLDQIHFIPLIDETARTNALRSGQVDFIEPVPPKDVNALRRDSRIVVTGGPNLSFVAISLNTSKKPFDDSRVRRALAYAIDRKEMVEKAFDADSAILGGK